MSGWNSSLVDYDSDAFQAGLDAGGMGDEATPPSQSPDYDSYMEGWIMGNCERDWEGD